MLQLNQQFTPRLTVRTSTAVVLKLLVIWRDMVTGKINYFPQSFTIATASADREQRQSSFSPFPTNCEILSATVVTTTSGVQRGQCYVRFEVVYQGDTSPVMTLRKGYVTSNGGLSYPDGVDEAATSGRGFITEIAGTLASFYGTITVPSYAQYTIHRAYATVVATSVAGNRSIGVNISDPASGWAYEGADMYTENQTFTVSAGVGMPYQKTVDAAGAIIYTLPLPHEVTIQVTGYFRLTTTVALEIISMIVNAEMWILD